jgi:uncharacterized protein (DUF1015 family)
MSDIRPFRGIRPRPDLAGRVASFPYDVIDSAEARVLADGNPYSFLHVCKPEIDLDPSISLYDDRVYRKGCENLRRFVEEGVLVRDAAPRLYVYQQRMGDHVQAGLVAACSVREYEQGTIKRHEFTRRDKEDDRTRHVTECNANAEPVFLAYPDRPAIDAIVDGVRARLPAHDVVTSDGIGHTVWVIDDPEEIRRIVGLFADIPALYVADGHHRTAAAVRNGQAARENNPAPRGDEPYEYFMAVVFPANQLKIMDYNRLVKDLNGLTPDGFRARISDRFEVVPADGPRPPARHSFGMYLEGRWWMLSARPGSFPADDPVRGLDVAILQENLLGPVLGIADPRTDKRIDFVGGIRGTDELVRRCERGAAVAFCMYPTSLDELMAVADAGHVMPPKSTWFEPKLRSGLVVRVLEDW